MQLCKPVLFPELLKKNANFPFLLSLLSMLLLTLCASFFLRSPPPCCVADLRVGSTQIGCLSLSLLRLPPSGSCQDLPLACPGTVLLTSNKFVPKLPLESVLKFFYQGD